MITIFEADSADAAWREAAASYRQGRYWNHRSSRTGPTDELLHAALVIRDPRQRWVLSRVPAINPAFAVAEVVWILNGRNDSAFLNYWNRRLPQFAGEGTTYCGAYGYRLRRQLGFDQIERAYQALTTNSDTRQVVLQVWDGATDMPGKDGQPVSSDVPCSVMALLKVVDRKLEWMQIVRSNDLFLGVPYNFVQFTFLQEILAGWLQLEVGSYNHLSDSLHVYEKDSTYLSNESTVEVLPNTDFFTQPKEQSEDCFRQLSGSADQLIRPDLTEGELLCLTGTCGLPRPYHNLLLLLAAEAARRRGWYEIMAQCAEDCTNPVLLQAWARWLARLELLVSI